MKAVKIILEPTHGWHIRNPATYRVERTYPVIPPTVLFGIIQNLLNTSAHRTSYRKIIALGGFPRSDIGLSLDMERIVKINLQKKDRPIFTDRHEIEVAHSDKIDAYAIVLDEYVDDYLPLLKKTVGDIVLLTTNQFPAVIRDIKVYDAKIDKSNTLLFCLSHEGVGMPHILPLHYVFGKKENYRAQKYYRVLLPYSPILSEHLIKKTGIYLKKEIEVITINGANFDAELLKLCENKWDKSINPIVGTM